MREHTDVDLVVDTDVFSYIFKEHTGRNVFLPLLEGKRLGLSVITLVETLEWAEHRNWGVRKRTDLETELRRYRIIPVSDGIARAFVRVGHDLRRQPIAERDQFIAATALVEGVPLVTHNVRHFERVPGLQLVGR